MLYFSVGLSNGGVRSESFVTLPQTSASREERLIKFSGIGPVDETGMPIASRSVSLHTANSTVQYRCNPTIHSCMAILPPGRHTSMRTIVKRMSQEIYSQQSLCLTSRRSPIIYSQATLNNIYHIAVVLILLGIFLFL